MFYVDKSRGEFTAVCCALFLSASIISSEPSESPVPYKLVSGMWCTELSLRIRCIQYLQILARFRYILVLASSMSCCIYRCWLQCMKADAAWCPQCRDTCLLLLVLGTIMATRAANWIEWLLLLQSGHNNSQQNLGSALNWQLTFSYE